MILYIFMFSELITTLLAQSLNPIITSWIKTNGTGYGGYTADVSKIQYSASYVYVSVNSIPSYSIGPWSNPNTPKAMNYTFKIPIRPQSVPDDRKIATPLSHNGILLNGVSIYNALDGYTYNCVWQRDAYVFEGVSFDSCNGHADGTGEYHNHANPVCMYKSNVSTAHSPLIGYAFDGWPIYGPYGYSSANSSLSSIKRMTSGYRLRSITNRTALANGTQLASSCWGPSINTTYPLGSFIQDYEWASGVGDLDAYNGRWCVTPEYKNGTYAYFISTSDDNLKPAYPYILGPYFYGFVSQDMFGPTSGRSTPNESVTTYYQYSTSSSSEPRLLLKSPFLIVIPISMFIISFS